MQLLTAPVTPVSKPSSVRTYWVSSCDHVVVNGVRHNCNFKVLRDGELVTDAMTGYAEIYYDYQTARFSADYFNTLVELGLK
jgi:hypothetical protein